jgi:hypothetical protein
LVLDKAGDTSWEVTKVTKPKSWKPQAKKKKPTAVPRTIYDQAADKAVIELNKLLNRRTELLTKLEEVNLQIPRMELIVRTYRPEAASAPAMPLGGALGPMPMPGGAGTWPVEGTVATPEEIAQKEAAWQAQHPVKAQPQDQEEFLRRFVPPPSRITGVRPNPVPSGPFNAATGPVPGESPDPDEFLNDGSA